MLEIVEDTNPIAVTKYGAVVEPKNNKVLIVDADTLVFRICLGAGETSPVLPKEFYTDEAWEEIINDPTYSEESGEITTLDLDLAMSMVNDKIEEFKELTGCDKVELHFTKGKESFRYRLFKEYKANRVNLKIPPALGEIKELVKTRYDNVYIHTKVEADDAVISRYKELYPKCILAAIDKDVLLSVPGRHFNYYTKPAYTNSKGERVPEVTPHFIDVSEIEALHNKYRQILTGDTTDNIHFKYGLGLKGVGEKKANTILKDCDTHEKCLKAVKDAYVKYQGKKFDIKEVNRNLLLTARLVSVEQYDMKSDKIILEKEDVWKI